MRWISRMAVISAIAASGVCFAESPDPRLGAIEQRLQATTLLREGATLSADQVAAAEAALAEAPADLEARTRLLGYYSSRGSAEAKKTMRGHILWIIENRPDAPVCGTRLCSINGEVASGSYERGAKAFLGHVKARGDEPIVLSNAARYFLRNDQPLAEQILLKGRALQPDNPEWPQRLAGLFQLRMRFDPPATRGEAALNALKYSKEAYDRIDSERGKMMALPRLARTALSANRLEEAHDFATRSLAAVEKLSESGAQGDAVHHGNLVLGELALAHGNLDEAKLRLLQSARTSGSPTLNSFGPNMSLAAQLLKRGERDAVLEYLEFCSNFWTRGAPRLAEWTQAIEAGRMPMFGANLAY